MVRSNERWQLTQLRLVGLAGIRCRGNDGAAESTLMADRGFRSHWLQLLSDSRSANRSKIWGFRSYEPTVTSWNSTSEMSLAVFTSNLAGSGEGLMEPHWSTDSRMKPLNISILALRITTVLPGVQTSICSARAKLSPTGIHPVCQENERFLAERMTQPVASPTTHSVTCSLEPSRRFFSTTTLTATTLTTKL